MAEKTPKVFNPDALFMAQDATAPVAADESAKVPIHIMKNADGTLTLTIPVIDQSFIGPTKNGNARIILELPELALTLRSSKGVEVQRRGCAFYNALTLMVR